MDSKISLIWCESVCQWRGETPSRVRIVLRQGSLSFFVSRRHDHQIPDKALDTVRGDAGTEIRYILLLCNNVLMYQYVMYIMYVMVNINKTVVRMRSTTAQPISHFLTGSLDQNSKGVLLGNSVIFFGGGCFFIFFHIFRIQNVVLLHSYIHSSYQLPGIAPKIGS